jgi:hypothetical protein
MEVLLELLSGGPRFVVPVKLFGFRRARTLLQVNADNALLELLDERSRYKCSVCNERVPWATEGLPCPSCHGIMQTVPDVELQANRYVLRIRRPQFRPLVAGEHTAQVTGAARIELEQAFKAIPERSPVNVLACSPTLEMGIDVGGLDAVVMRNIPPRPDNYAQRGGRSGRRTRVGMVVGYARSTPHDGYFFDKPREMIAGEVPAPSVGLTNRDVLRRHLNAILFGTTNPPLAGRMSEYLDNQGALRPEAIEALIAGLTLHVPAASETAWEAFGPSLMAQAGFGSVEDLKSEYQQLPGAIEDLLDRTRLQIIRLRDAISRWNELLQGGRQALQAASLINRLWGFPIEMLPKAPRPTTEAPGIRCVGLLNSVSCRGMSSPTSLALCASSATTTRMKRSPWNAALELANTNQEHRSTHEGIAGASSASIWLHHGTPRPPSPAGFTPSALIASFVMKHKNRSVLAAARLSLVVRIAAWRVMSLAASWPCAAIVPCSRRRTVTRRDHSSSAIRSMTVRSLLDTGCRMGGVCSCALVRRCDG